MNVLVPGAIRRHSATPESATQPQLSAPAPSDSTPCVAFLPHTRRKHAECRADPLCDATRHHTLYTSAEPAACLSHWSRRYTSAESKAEVHHCSQLTFASRDLRHDPLPVRTDHPEC